MCIQGLGHFSPLPLPRNDKLISSKLKISSQALWLKPIILATWEAKIQGIIVQGQPWQNILKTPSQPIKAGHGGMCLSYQLCGEAQIGRL
jgi:hypothetical protein